MAEHETVTKAEVDSKITTHKGDASAHHAKTTNASELTSGALNSAGRLPALTSGKIWAGNASNRPAEEDKPGWIASGNYSAGDTITDQCSPADFEVEAGGAYTKVVEFCLPRGGTIRVKFDIRATTAKTYGRIYRNGGAVGTEQSTESDTFVTFSEDMAGWSAGDLLQLYIKNPLGGGVSAKAANLRLYTG